MQKIDLSKSTFLLFYYFSLGVNQMFSPKTYVGLMKVCETYHFTVLKKIQKLILISKKMEFPTFFLLKLLLFAITSLVS